MAGYGVIPSIRVSDVPAALRFYSGTLGFELLRGGPDEANNSLRRGEAQIMIESAGSFYSPGYNAAIAERINAASATALYIEADDLDNLHARLLTAGIPVIDPLAAREWGQSEFTVADPFGNWLTFWKASS